MAAEARNFQTQASSALGGRFGMFARNLAMPPPLFLQDKDPLGWRCAAFSLPRLINKLRSETSRRKRVRHLVGTILFAKNLEK